MIYTLKCIVRITSDNLISNFYDVLTLISCIDAHQPLQSLHLYTHFYGCLGLNYPLFCWHSRTLSDS